MLGGRGPRSDDNARLSMARDYCAFDATSGAQLTFISQPLGVGEDRLLPQANRGPWQPGGGVLSSSHSHPTHSRNCSPEQTEEPPRGRGRLTEVRPAQRKL